ncbi:sugar kinase [Tropicimonas sp. IMCC6043]|uniref:sugar kinase n=1 Tax=Tropicimonas sp. IMCC6043 TaxID=2510645 RepID=UPI00101DD363|nr:sugar kinase [Tropicimonas sp. IMCC6043]RYH09303.1 sugar kinase [Tropicimonas sp. IMCC6043]
MKPIAVIGEVLVEIMADTIGEGFRGPIALTGPYPSGAPAIFADQVARMGQPSTVISTVGDDDFGRLNLDRLAVDGVDISGIGIDPDRPTGSAFVRYRADGSRDFIFNIRHSACGVLPDTEAARKVLDAAGHLHVMGSSLSSPDFVALNLRAARDVKARGGSISFDPNLRKEILDAPGMRAAMAEILRMTDLFLPSGEELFLLTEAGEAEAAVAELLGLGIGTVVHKLGAEGVRHHDSAGSTFFPAFTVEEVDPTGAGDCFGGAFTALWLQGAGLDEALPLSAAAGALAVTRRGPMEGTTPLDALRAFVAGQERRTS